MNFSFRAQKSSLLEFLRAIGALSPINSDFFACFTRHENDYYAVNEAQYVFKLISKIIHLLMIQVCGSSFGFVLLVFLHGEDH